MTTYPFERLALSTLHGYRCRRGPGNKRVLIGERNGKRTQVMQFEVMETSEHSEASMQETITRKPVTTMRCWFAKLLMWLSQVLLDTAHQHHLDARRHYHKAMKHCDRAQRLQIKAKLLQG